MLDGFLRLESDTNEAILVYAQRWGPLWLCAAHDLPFRHDPECRTFRDFEPVSDEVFWETYFQLAEAIGRQQMQASVEFQRQVVAGVLNQWLSMAGVRPRLEWGTGNPQVQLGGDGLIGALAVQLFFACSQTGARRSARRAAPHSFPPGVGGVRI